jgi:tRNA-dihydrouridine synthase C
MPVIANGEIWTVADAAALPRRDRLRRLMIGRGMVTDPGLALAIKGRAAVPWSRIACRCWPVFWQQVSARVERRHRAGRLKQWLNYLRNRHPEAQQAFDELRLSNDPAHRGLAGRQRTAAPAGGPARRPDASLQQKLPQPC